MAIASGSSGSCSSLSSKLQYVFLAQKRHNLVFGRFPEEQSVRRRSITGHHDLDVNRPQIKGKGGFDMGIRLYDWRSIYNSAH
jgi:hypothetical protein